jgi:hypothetical protein
MLRWRSICSYRLAKALLDANSFIVAVCWKRDGKAVAVAVAVDLALLVRFEFID